jgi:serine/threonine protein kinase
MLSPGTRLGSFEVVSPLGAGAMGEVWRARDTRLGREVALKLLPDGFASDPDRLGRFEREARLLASLSHPNIAVLHEIEEVDERRILVMELVEGLTLAERVHGGCLPVRESLEVARQLAEALEAAHEKGIVHRDLKPSNVKITPDGRVKVLDFGLARAFGWHDAGDSSLSPTKTADTSAGVVVGTTAYMSPEQARGQPVDGRTDVWALGCVLYEMLTGGRAFAGTTAPDVVAAVLDREPDLAALPTGTPAPVRSLLRRCLQKDKARRLRDVADARLEIEEALGALSSASSPSYGRESGAGASAGISSHRSSWRARRGSRWLALEPRRSGPPLAAASLQRPA